jgi:uncharacterized protein YkwD
MNLNSAYRADKFTFIILLLIFCSCSKDEEIKEDLSIGMLTEVNKLRKEGCQCGPDSMPPVPEVKWNNALQFAAERHAEDMYKNNYFSHLSLDGKPPAQRALEAGYSGNDVGENIAKGYTTIKEVMNGWKNSESHCKLMMDSLYSEMGAGRYKDYWVLDFGNPL